jgi:hypothetical protein
MCWTSSADAQAYWSTYHSTLILSMLQASNYATYQPHISHPGVNFVIYWQPLTCFYNLIASVLNQCMLAC